MVPKYQTNKPIDHFDRDNFLSVQRDFGIAGGPEKCSFVKDELGFDACVDYKAGNLVADLADACPDGVDIYFENVCGEVMKALANYDKFFGEGATHDVRKSYTQRVI